MTAIKIKDDVLRVLSAAETNGPYLVLVGKLDRKLYEETNKVLLAAGGKWDRRAKAHVFEGDAIDAIEPIILTGEYRRVKQDFGQFDTPLPLAMEIVRRAEIELYMRVLEPSAGVGNLALTARLNGGLVTTWEIDPKRAEALRKVVDAVNVGDFLQVGVFETLVFDRVIMNPPFAKQADIDHVMHAAKFLRPGGKLVAIMSASVTFRENRKTVEFRKFVADHGGTIERLPEGSFEASGTSVNTCVVSFRT